MNILGLNLEEDCSVAIMKDDLVIAASSEERFTRTKSYAGFPKNAINYCLEHAELTIDDIDIFAVADLGVSIAGIVYSYLQRRASFSIKDYVKEANEFWYKKLYENEDVDYLELFKDKLDKSIFPEEFTEYFFENIEKYKNADIKDIQQLKKRLIKAYYPTIPEDKIKFFPHHEIHAFYGFYGSSFAEQKEPVLVLTADSWGDFENATISKFENGKYELLETIDNSNLGWAFRNMTLHLGMKPYHHEYKVMGLAPYAPDYLTEEAYKVFDQTMQVDGVNFKYKEKPQDYYFWFKERLEGIRFDGVAGGLQKYFEDRIEKWVTNAVEKYGIRKVCFSGGLAMNIKANMYLAQLDCIDDFFVAASPEDSSNSIGVCFLALYRDIEAQNKNITVPPLESMYLGPDIKDEEITEVIDKNDLGSFCDISKNVDAKFVASRLSNGVVIGRCSGRMEFGARALGNRSIIADPQDLSLVNRINRIIKKRDFWMPFAPVVMDKYWDKYLINKKNLVSPYMTVGFATTDEGANAMAAGIHSADKTTRPQMLKREDNPDYYDIIDEFEKLTNVGAMLNTSFNLHGYPIVLNAADAIVVFLNSDLDALLLNDTFIEKREKKYL